MSAKLSVNINKIATLRNARGGNTPSVTEAAKNCQLFGADGITIHPRPDERHITLKDVYDIAPLITTEYNIEGYPDERFMKIIADVKPTQATLVPDPPDVLTSENGWDTVKNYDFLVEVIQRLHSMGIRTSLFIETDAKMIENAAKVGADRIEFYTGPYAHNYSKDKAAAIAPYKESAAIATKNGLGINAGHDLSLENLEFFADEITDLLEVSIGHALISDAIYLGLENTINMYKKLLL
ncbi:pyridoxine 5'-phosphate synthase [Paracrocinitomix mangrovi]|uniref:pyridoxine 5'-phosphate synthase n=1 Tax=Paracrocinitomix mangrovi TaxID=2862509 RepID=UPI001C8EA6B0|nr:pyridoxine 5'-phosphate synthase [Paracrocinitomix mangrovi]UKN01110.1 pyridoxine 5'-phosphate synthase [Paracrocinitomix mangrovi]